MTISLGRVLAIIALVLAILTLLGVGSWTLVAVILLALAILSPA